MFYALSSRQVEVFLSLALVTFEGEPFWLIILSQKCLGEYVRTGKFLLILNVFIIIVFSVECELYKLMAAVVFILSFGTSE